MRNDYSIVNFVGGGANGIVVKAWRLQAGQRMEVLAIKLVYADGSFTEAEAKQLQWESIALNRVSSPFVVALKTSFLSSSVCAIVMEYLDGDSLDKLIIRSSPSAVMDESEGLFCLTNMLQGLKHIHSHGLVHRDIKSGNIVPVLLAEGKRYVLIDRGIAATTSATFATKADAMQSIRTVMRTSSENIVRTPQYMSPEAIQDLLLVNNQSDLFSAGLTMFHLISGKVPFEGATPIMIMAAVIHTGQPLLNELCACSPAFARIVDRALQKKLPDRYQSAQEMLNDVETEMVRFDDNLKVVLEAQEEMKKHLLAKHQQELGLLQHRMQIESTELNTMMSTKREQKMREIDELNSRTEDTMSQKMLSFDEKQMRIPHQNGRVADRSRGRNRVL